LQPIIDSAVIQEPTTVVDLQTVNWQLFDNEQSARLELYLNGENLTSGYSRVAGQFTFEKELMKGDAVYIKVFCNTSPDRGYYQIPIGLEKNPLNGTMETFTYGTAADHLSSALEFFNQLEGPILGANNIRDVAGFQQYGTRILKHVGSAPLAITLLADKEINIIKSLQYAKKQYSDFKNSFIDLASKLDYDGNPVEFVDDILSELSRVKTSDNPFADSDMAGSGAFTPITYIVEDTGISTFALSEKFDLSTLSRRAVYAYLNNEHLIFNRDYTFDSTFGFIKISVELNEGDLVEIKEYVSTASNFIPPTPTKLGLYKKYFPQKFLDDTYLEPRQVIQGHDGSITAAFGDYRDDVLLE
jgi:hypothetical protein